MLTKLSLGAELDIVTGDELESGLNDVVDSLRRDPDPKPQYFSRPGSKQGPGTFNVVVGSPPVGRIWNILGVTICGQDDATQPSTGTVAMYFGDPANPMRSQLKMPRIVVPSLTTFSGKTLWCLPTEFVFFVVTNTDLTEVTGTVHVAEWREIDVVQHTGR